MLKVQNYYNGYQVTDSEAVLYQTKVNSPWVIGKQDQEVIIPIDQTRKSNVEKTLELLLSKAPYGDNFLRSDGGYYFDEQLAILLQDYEDYPIMQDKSKIDYTTLKEIVRRMFSEKDPIFTLIFTGDSGCGKTCAINRVLSDFVPLSFLKGLESFNTSDHFTTNCDQRYNIIKSKSIKINSVPFELDTETFILDILFKDAEEVNNSILSHIAYQIASLRKESLLITKEEIESILTPSPGNAYTLNLFDIDPLVYIDQIYDVINSNNTEEQLGIKEWKDLLGNIVKTMSETILRRVAKICIDTCSQNFGIAITENHSSLVGEKIVLRINYQDNINGLRTLVGSSADNEHLSIGAFLDDVNYYFYTQNKKLTINLTLLDTIGTDHRILSGAKSLDTSKYFNFANIRFYSAKETHQNLINSPEKLRNWKDELQALSKVDNTYIFMSNVGKKKELEIWLKLSGTKGFITDMLMHTSLDGKIDYFKVFDNIINPVDAPIKTIAQPITKNPITEEAAKRAISDFIHECEKQENLGQEWMALDDYLNRTRFGFSKSNFSYSDNIFSCDDTLAYSLKRLAGSKSRDRHLYTFINLNFAIEMNEIYKLRNGKSGQHKRRVRALIEFINQYKNLLIFILRSFG
jgi:GTPase SAR1 family protein